MFLVVRYMTGHCGLGALAIPRENYFQDLTLFGSSIRWTTLSMGARLYVMYGIGGFMFGPGDWGFARIRVAAWLPLWVFLRILWE